MACGQQGGERVEGRLGRWVMVGGVLVFQGSQRPESSARGLPLWVRLLPSSTMKYCTTALLLSGLHPGAPRFGSSKGPIARNKSGHQGCGASKRGSGVGALRAGGSPSWVYLKGQW